MLKQRSQFLESLLYLTDLGVITGAWLLAFAIRFGGWPVPVFFGVPDPREYLVPLLLLPLVWGLLFKTLHLYRPKVLDSRTGEALDILKASTITALCLMSASHLLTKLSMSRVFVVYFWVLATVMLWLVRVIFRRSVQAAHNRGHNLRQALIVGTEELGLRVRQQIDLHPELSLNIRGYLSRDPDEVGQRKDGLEVLGHIDDLQRVLRAEGIDLVLIALPNESQPRLETLISEMDSELVDIKVVPDLYRYALARGSVEEFEGLPIISLSGPPMVGWRRVAKRTLDLAVALPALILVSPLLGFIALAVKLGSPGPVFYVQQRMGLDGKTFKLAKFRTMVVDAEKQTGPVWARNEDPRCTSIGRFLRRTSLDELPQLWHVLMGEMSLVGPRPERPVFIEDFRKSIPKYMLRHRVKAGITGWAQVNGWRGDTCIQKRLEHDLFYIQNWSLGFDAKIMWLTMIRGFRNNNAY